MHILRASSALLVGLVLAGASTSASAEIITFEDVSAGAFTSPSSFSTIAVPSGNYTFNIDGGKAAVDNGAPGSDSDTACVANSGTRCSTNGTQALYSFTDGTLGSVTLLPAVGFTLSITGFDAAIATLNQLIIPGNDCIDPLTGILDPLCTIIPDTVLDFSLPTDIHLTGVLHAGGTVTQDFALIPPILGGTGDQFTPQTFVPPGAFAGLDSLTFAFINDPLVCIVGCTGDFAIDNLDVSSTPIRTAGGPTGVPEPGTLGLLGAGFVGFGWLRRKMKRNAA